MTNSRTTKATLQDQMLQTTKRTLSIETKCTTENLAKCNPQSQSPLFFKLPQELRDLIWLFASTQDERLDKQYPETAYYYRPGYRGPLRTSTAHLLTCRLAWLEANALPLQQASLPLWLLRGPHDLKPSPRTWQMSEGRELTRWEQNLNMMTTNNIRNVTNIHLFTQMFELGRLTSEDHLWSAILGRNIQPKTIRVTIRQSDWQNWEQGEPLELDDNYIQDVLGSPYLSSVSKFVLELETDESRKTELDGIVEQLPALQGTSKTATEGSPASAKFVCDTPSRRWQWSRSSRLDDKDWTVFEDKPELQLHVAELTWRNTYPSAPATAVPQPPSATGPHQANSALRTLSDTRTYINRSRFVRGNAFELGLWRLAMQRRHQAVELSAERWAGLGHEYQWAVVWTDSVDFASQQMVLNRSRFETLMGDYQGRKLLRHWAENGSLLKLEGLETDNA